MSRNLVAFVVAAIGFGIVSLYMDYYFLEPKDAFTEPMGESYLLIFGILAFIIAGIIIALKITYSFKRSSF